MDTHTEESTPPSNHRSNPLVTPLLTPIPSFERYDFTLNPNLDIVQESALHPLHTSVVQRLQRYNNYSRFKRVALERVLKHMAEVASLYRSQSSRSIFRTLQSDLFLEHYNLIYF